MNVTEVNSNELACVLFQEFIENKDQNLNTFLKIDDEKIPLFEEKLKLYRLALVLIVLILEEQNNSKFSQVRANLESLVFSMPQKQSMEFFQNVKQAMHHLSNLLFSREGSKEMSWAMYWLRDIGIEENNPVTLALFAMKWMQFFTTITESVREFKII